MMLCRFIQTVRHTSMMGRLGAVGRLGVRQSSLPLLKTDTLALRCYKSPGCNQSLLSLEYSSTLRKCSHQFVREYHLTTRCNVLKRFKSDSTKPAASDDKKLTIMQKFKKAYKEHGKVLIAVHCTCYCMYFGSFYYAATKGLDVIPLMERLGFSETLIKPFRQSGLGNLAVAFLLCKLISPIRYATTIGGTGLVIRYLRSHGKVLSKQDHKTLTRSARKDVGEKFKQRQVAFKNKYGGLRKRVNVRLKDLSKTGRSRLRLTTSRLMGRVRKNNKTVREKGKSLQSKANNHLGDLSKSGQSNLKRTTTKLMSRVKRRRKNNASGK